ncbi:transcription factor HHO3-like [Nymphaea colorata]|nr:transcription factor HHO3-like [Nymphaea colorata]
MEMGRCQEYIDALEEERKKIQVFQRELPLCLQLVTQAIEACRQQLEAEIGGAGSDCEETSSEGPVLEEFIPLKKDSEDTQKENCREETKEDGCGDTSEKDEKPDWLRSVQLWSQDAESTPKEDVDSYRKSLSSETKKRGAFHPFCKEKKAPSDPSPAPSAVAAPAATVAASSATTKGEDKEGSAQKKTRRCWSPELHHRFLHALQQLGGSHAATPKQIRELMKVDGLTNDEVKSHLQKYRLHTRRVPSTSIPMSSSQPAQFVVVGGIWVPPDYSNSTVAPSAHHPEAAPRTVYAPVATSTAPSTVTTTSLPAANSKPKKQLQQQSPDGPLSPERRAGGGKCGSRESVGEDSSSSATSSSHTTTSPAM